MQSFIFCTTFSRRSGGRITECRHIANALTLVAMLQNKMSSTILNIISTNPSYVPDKTKQDKAKDLLSKIYIEEKIEFNTTDTIEFIDQGSNFESVFCNLCGRTIEIEEWQNAMDKAYESQFTDLIFITHCCDKTTSLNDLKYEWPAGFGKFTISVSDAQTEIDEKDLKKLQDILSTTLRIIWAHY